ncbi:pyroglutamyl-peptidase I [Alsobacter sp. R-9]
MSPPRLLVTGFGPYPKVRVNPTGVIARRLGASRRLARLGIAVTAQVLETSYAAAGAAVPPLIAAVEPDACLHLGLAPRERVIRIETRGENRTRRLSPDVRGRRPASLKLRPEAPAALRGTPRAAALLAGLRRQGLPARLSQDAGAYLCNAMYFWSLDEARRAGRDRPVVFVHLPWPAPAAGTRKLSASRRPRIPLDVLIAALEEIAVALVVEGRNHHAQAT